MKQLMFLALCSFFSVLAVAQAPAQINYQGIARNSTGTTLPNQNINLRLSVHESNAKGAVVYQETRKIKTDRFGMFVVAIGSNGATNTVNTIKEVNWGNGEDKFLQVEISMKNDNNFMDMGTSKLLSVPYAFSAETAQPVGMAGGSLSGTYPNPQIGGQAITSYNIADSTITAAKIAPGVLSKFVNQGATGDIFGVYPNLQIVNNAVTSSKISKSAVQTINIADGAVTVSKIAAGVLPVTLPPTGTASGDLTGTYPAPNLGVNVVKTTNVADGSITGAKLATGVIPTTLPPKGAAGGDLAGTYPAPILATNVVKTANVLDGSITASKIANGVIPTSLPPNGNAGGDLAGLYPNPQIGAQVITDYNIADGTITAAKLATGVLSKKNNGPAGGDLSGMYPDPSIANNVIKTQNLVNGSVTAAKLAAGLIPTTLPPNGTAGGALSGTYPSPSLSANAVTSSTIADGSVTTAKLAIGVIPSTLPPSGTASGDLSGSFPNPGVARLRGITIGNTAPVLGQVLKFDGTQWAPAADNAGSFSVPYSSSFTSAANLFSITNAGMGAGLEGINAGMNNNAFGVLGQISSTTPSTTSSAVRGINSGTQTSGYGVWGTHAGGGTGVYGTSPSGTGVNGFSDGGTGVSAGSTSGTGVFATSNDGVAAQFDISNPNSFADAVYSSNAGYGNGITAIANYGNGVLGIGNDTYGTGVLGINNAGGEAILGFTISSDASAIVGRNDGTYAAVRGFNTSNNGIGVLALANAWGASNGTALVAELEGSDPGNTAVFRANNANVARIDNTGKGFFNGGTQMGGADIAEYFDVEGNAKQYEPGDVLIISQSSDRTVEKSSKPYSNLTAGVYATKPGVLLTEKNAEQDALDLMVPMGVIGVLPTKVSLEGGPIMRGDLLVTSSTPGVAMKADLDKVKVGQVLGKALESYSGNDVGKISVLVSVK